MNTKIHNFQESLGIANQLTKKGGKPAEKHLMLGNGFSVDLFPTIFNYKVLADRITSQRIKELFKNMRTHDFEYVMRRLTDAQEVTNFYPNSDAVSEELRKDVEELRSTLIEVINASHPANPTSIAEEQYELCREFLRHFDGGRKYSFNYDLLLYWVYMHFLDDTEKSLKFDDGFRHPEHDQSIVTWEIGREQEQSVFYLHGAMHIFRNGGEVEKYTWLNSGKTISEQVRESIAQQKYPLFISEGTTEHKLSRIQDCSYLGRAFSSLKRITGNLFIFGHSIRDEDEHVFDYINTQNTGLKNIFISLFGDSSKLDNQRIIAKVEQWKVAHPNKQYIFYDSKSANVWRNQL